MKLRSSLVFLCLSNRFRRVDANQSCSFISNAPIVEEEIPSFQYNLKFLNVDATVYRHVNSGSKPKIKVLRYSSAPLIDVNINSKEIIVSSADSDCLDHSGISLKKRNTSKFSIFTTAAATAIIFGHGTNAFSTCTILLLGLTMADAKQMSCTPAMEIVIEAPPYYLGSVAECVAEVTDPNHCPSDFPTFPTCADHNPSCQVAVVGAGTGGLYTAMRLVDENKMDAKDICIFEATERVGGRLYSLRGFGPNKKITVDAGGYRSWPEYTPTTHALIEEYLGLKTGCYEDENLLTEPCEKFNIVDDDGIKIGFATLPEEMMRRLTNEGSCFFPRHEMTSLIHNADGSNTLLFANGAIASDVPQVILNVPQRPLLKILRKSNIPFGSASEERSLYDAVHSVQTEIVTKLYLYYDDAWWYKLGLHNGDFEMSGDAQNMLLKGRYHDGHTECDIDGGCHGFLLAVYAHDFGGNQAQFFRRYQRDRPEPITIISNTDIEGASFLKHAHDRLKLYHKYHAVNATYTGFEAQQLFDEVNEPTFAVLATWNIGTFGAGGGWHHWTDLNEVNNAIKPLNDYKIHVVNEAYSKLQGWAEGTLLSADEVLEDYFSVPRPWSFDTPDNVQLLAQTSSQECTEETDGDGGGGGVVSSGGGGDGGNDSILCFASDALVEMADGRLKKIVDVEKGDEVNTGFLGNVGIVTEVLAHKVFKDVEVASLSSQYGTLVGTLDHPIYFNDQWMELAEAVRYRFEKEENNESSFLKINGTIKNKFVDMFYNLEVDGDIPGLSNHSYVVNGVIASGLGDNNILNSLFARQSIWKTKKVIV